MKAADAKLEHANERLHQHALTPHKSTDLHAKHKQADVSTNSHTCRAQITHTNYSSGTMRDSIAMFIFMMACRDVPLRQLLGASRRRAFGFVKLNTHPKRLEGYGEEHRDRAWRETRDRGMLFACDVGSWPGGARCFSSCWGVAMFLFVLGCRDVPLRQLLGASRRRAFGFVKLNTHPKRLEGYGEEHRDRAWRETRDRGMLFACDVGSSPWAIAMFLFGWGVAMFLFGNSKAQLGSVPSDLVDK